MHPTRLTGKVLMRVLGIKGFHASSMNLTVPNSFWYSKALPDRILQVRVGGEVPFAATVTLGNGRTVWGEKQPPRRVSKFESLEKLDECLARFETWAPKARGGLKSGS